VGKAPTGVLMYKKEVDFFKEELRVGRRPGKKGKNAGRETSKNEPRKSSQESHTLRDGKGLGGDSVP